MSIATKASILYRIGSDPEKEMPVSAMIVNSVTSLHIDDEIPDGLYFFNTDITQLSIGCGVTRIGNNAFEDCVNLSGTIDIPSSVTEIGDAAFYNSGANRFNFYGASAPVLLNPNAFGPNYTTVEIHCPVGYSFEYGAFSLYSIIIDDLELNAI